MITLGTLRWDNCFSYSTNNHVDLANSNLTQLIGTNGVGKSSIPLILEEVLYNKNSRESKKQIYRIDIIIKVIISHWILRLKESSIR